MATRTLRSCALATALVTTTVGVPPLSMAARLTVRPIDERPADIGPGAQCFVNLRFYDAIGISYLRMTEGWLGDCVSLVEGLAVTAPDPFRPGRIHLEFPPEFEGPETLLRCEVNYFDNECPAVSLERLFWDFGIEEARDLDDMPIPSLTLCPVRFECDEYCPSPLFPPGPYVAGLCGDANADDEITAADALITLQTAVSAAECGLAQCDANNDGSIHAGDALHILSAAVGTGPELACPFPCPSQEPK